MQTKNIIYIAIAAVVIIAAVAFLGFRHNGNNAPVLKSSGTTTIASSVNAVQGNSSMLFSNQPYAQYSYLISGSNISQQAQYALAGFNMSTTTLPNGTTAVTLTVIGTNVYKTIDLAKGYKLYIVEGTFGDEGYRFDSSLSDDGFVVVDPNGYVV